MERDVVLTPPLNDTPAELAQPYGGEDWRQRQVRAHSRPDHAAHHGGRAGLPRHLYDRFTSLGPLLEEKGNGSKGIAWETQDEVERLRHAQPPDAAGRDQRHAADETDIDAIEIVLSLAPETNGHVAVKAWQALSR